MRTDSFQLPTITSIIQLTSWNNAFQTSCNNRLLFFTIPTTSSIHYLQCLHHILSTWWATRVPFEPLSIHQIDHLSRTKPLMMIFAPSESYRSPPLFGPVIEAKYEFYFNRLRALEIYKTAITGNLQMKRRGGSSSSRYSPSLFLFLFHSLCEP